MTPDVAPELVEPELVVPELVEPELEPEPVVPELVEPELVEPDAAEVEPVEPELEELDPLEPEVVEPLPVEPDAFVAVALVAEAVALVAEADAVVPVEALLLVDAPEPEDCVAVAVDKFVVALCAGLTAWMKTASPRVEPATPPNAARRTFRMRLTAASRLLVAVRSSRSWS